MLKDTKLDAVLSALIAPLKNLLDKKIKDVETEIADINTSLADLEDGTEKKANKLTEYKDEAHTEEQYYSAKATDEALLYVATNVLDLVREDIEALATEIQGDLDEIGDLVGGEENGETITLIETAEYEFIDAPENSFGWGSELQLEVTALPKLDTPYNFVFGEVNSQITFTFSEEHNAFFAGNKSLIGLGENTGETYLVGIGLVDSSYLVAVYTSEPAGTYTVGLSYSGGEE